MPETSAMRTLAGSKFWNNQGGNAYRSDDCKQMPQAQCCKTNRPPSRVRPEFQARSTTATDLISSIFTTSMVHSAASGVSGAGMEPLDAAEPGMADAGRRRDGTSQQRTSADGLHNRPRWPDEGILISIPSKQPKTVSGLQGSTYGGETAPSGHATSI